MSSTLRFLDHVPRFMFFTGKGGVGGLLACAGCRSRRPGTAGPADQHGPCLNVVSLRPECRDRSDSDRHCYQPVGGEIDPIRAQATASGTRSRQGLLPPDVLAGIEEQLSGGCTTEIAAFDEFTTLLTDPELAATFDHIIFDTAPTGHTIRMLQLPAAWTGFIESTDGGVSSVGPLAGPAKNHERYSVRWLPFKPPTYPPRARLPPTTHRPERSGSHLR